MGQQAAPTPPALRLSHLKSCLGGSSYYKFRQRIRGILSYRLDFIMSFRSPGALFTEHEASQLIAQLLRFFGITRFPEAFRQLKKGLLLFLARLDSLLDQLHQDTVIAEAALLRHGFHLLRDFSRQGYASPHLLCCAFCRRHSVINIHQFGAIRSALETSVPL